MAGDVSIDVKGLEAVVKKFRNAPKTLEREMKKGMQASLDVVQEKVPGYPPQRANQTTPYKRTGTLARSLGVSQGGTKAGKPTVYSISGSGKNMQGRFGTNLSYAKYVIGDPDSQQAHMHKGWWWTIDLVARRAKDKVVAVWNEFIKRALDS